ncbi:MAG: PAS domain-containing protein [Epsilonproteobacteria bacterium]|nr:PAS domain-containing protein [Campylobacterota bacterium]
MMYFHYRRHEFMQSEVCYASLIHKDDLPMVLAQVQDAIDKELSYFEHKPYRIITKEDEEKWILDHSLVIRDSENQVTHFLGYLVDVTELKSSEEEIKRVRDRLQVAIDGSNDGLWDWNMVTNEAYFSPRWKSMLGYAEEEIGSHVEEWTNRVHAKDVKQTFLDVQAHINGDTEVYDNVHRMRHKDGHWVWIHDRGKALFNESGQAVRMVGFHTDVSRQKKLEKQLSRINQTLEEKVQTQVEDIRKKDEILQQQAKLAAMGEMIGAIAHQWRQPLNALNINIQNLDDDYAEGLIDATFIEDFIEENKRTISFMSDTIDDFRNFFRIDKQKRNFSVKKAIHKTVSIQQAQLQNRGIKVSVHGEDYLIYGLENEFQQVILNLLSNAKDIIEQRGISDGEIEIELQDCKVHVMDNGEGIPEAIMDRIFEPYFSTKEQGKGTGIGLYMSKMIIQENMGGSLDVKNSDQGALFTIAFDSCKVQT